MKWTIEKNVILEALNNVTKALSQRTTIPVLNGIVDCHLLALVHHLVPCLVAIVSINGF